MQVDGVYIDSLGVDLHEWADAEQAVADGLLSQEMLTTTGLTGACVAGETPAMDLAANAARQALSRSKIQPDEISVHLHSAVAYQGPEGSYPPGYIMRELGLGNIPAFYLRQGCNGMLGALEIAIGQITGAAAAESVLITTGENFSSSGINRWADGQNQTYILGDGGASALVSADEGIAEVKSLNAGVLHRLERWHRGNGPLYDDGTEASDMTAMTQQTMDFYESDLSITETFEWMTRFDLEIMQRTLVDAGLNASDVSKVLTTHVDRRVVEYAVMAPLGLPMSRSGFEFGKRVGHVGGADVFLALEHMIRTREVGPGDNVLLMSHGPGWICTAAALTITESPEWELG
ncbi:ketoacyl-ACP synthase III family protein [Streptomyces europaeiscabiei]|uniref:ketoacyl-ACP synthase III family protein n=1 Tax=Streptomyces europaeiscabiei TaxID=146819 RepID=UPI002E19AEA3